MVRYSRDFPNIAVNVTVDYGETLISMMYTNVLDLITAAYNIDASSPISQPYKESKVVLAGKREQYSCLQKRIRGKDSSNLPLIYSNMWNNYLSDISEHLLLDGRIYRIHCNMLGNAKDFCIVGLGYYFLSADLIEHEPEIEISVEIPVGEISTRHVNLYATYNRVRLGFAAAKYFFKLSPQMIPKQVLR